jgi:hypothetical protein
MFFECPAKESHSKFSTANQNDELWEDQATRPKMWKADDSYYYTKYDKKRN